MKYTEVNITLSQLEPYRDLLIDALGNEGPYDSFVETPDGLKAYVPTDQYDPQWLKNQLEELSQLSTLVVSQSERSVNPFTLPSQRNVNEVNSQFSIQELPDKDWNEEWEKQHQPVLVEAGNGKRIWVRAPFHEHRANVDYEIEIEPKMSFGTAHHATTYMMLSYVAELPMEGLRVLDMGCGTAVLGILAKMRGAAYVEGIDIDEWAYNNAIENVQRNNVEMTIRIGDTTLLADRHDRFNIIIANINRNILLNDMAAYAAVLSHGGTLLLSGFYESDIPTLQQHAQSLGLHLHQIKTRQSWAALLLTKA